MRTCRDARGFLLPPGYGGGQSGGARPHSAAPGGPPRAGQHRGGGVQRQSRVKGLGRVVAAGGAAQAGAGGAAAAGTRGIAVAGTGGIAVTIAGDGQGVAPPDVVAGVIVVADLVDDGGPAGNGIIGSAGIGQLGAGVNGGHHALVLLLRTGVGAGGQVVVVGDGHDHSVRRHGVGNVHHAQIREAHGQCAARPTKILFRIGKGGGLSGQIEGPIGVFVRIVAADSGFDRNAAAAGDIRDAGQRRGQEQQGHAKRQQQAQQAPVGAVVLFHRQYLPVDVFPYSTRCSGGRNRVAGIANCHFRQRFDISPFQAARAVV